MASQVESIPKPTTRPADRARFALVAALYKQQLGNIISARREELGLTQRELADRANVEESQTVSRWERGLNQPTDLDAVATALEWTLPELLGQLRPAHQKERRRLDPDGPTQLDRIEALLSEIAERLDHHGLTLPTTADVVEAEAPRTGKQPVRSDSSKPGTQRKRRAA